MRYRRQGKPVFFALREGRDRNQYPAEHPGSFREEKFVKLESEFKPNILNTTVYILSVALQISTFAVNYRVS